MQSFEQRSAQAAAGAAVPAAWHVYFKDSAFSQQDRRALLIQELLAAFGTEQGWRLISNVQQCQHGYVLPLDYEQLSVICNSPDLAAALEMQPLEGIACLNASVHEVSSSKQMLKQFCSCKCCFVLHSSTG